MYFIIFNLNIIIESTCGEVNNSVRFINNIVVLSLFLKIVLTGIIEVRIL